MRDCASVPGQVRAVYSVIVVALMLFIATMAIAPASANAKGRVALVIGNGSYTNAAPLINPASDASLITASLKTLGFTVVSLIDGDHSSMLKMLAKFGRLAENADIALFFYAGHGLQVAGKNWLLPVNADIASRTDLPASAISANSVLELMELSGAKARIAILDACRNNPLSRSLTRATTRGLAKIDSSAAGTMVVFATAPGDVALDGSGTNSPFSKALSQQMLTPGIEVRQMIGRVRSDVMAQTNDKQVPWVNEAIVGEIYLASPPKIVEAPVKAIQNPTPSINLAMQQSANNTAQEIAFWNSVKDSKVREVLELYINKYPEGVFVEIARANIRNLGTRPQLPTPLAQPVPTPSNQQQIATNNRSLELERDMELGARQLIVDMQSVSSADASESLRSLARIYADQVSFYDQQYSLDEIRRDKRNYLKRWPSRYFRARDDTIDIFCDSNNNRCDVDVIIDWQVASKKRNSSISGASTMRFEVQFNQAGPQIVSESGEVLYRNKK